MGSATPYESGAHLVRYNEKTPAMRQHPEAVIPQKALCEMSRRYRLYPTDDQAALMRMHCGHARFVWNLAIEQSQHARRLGQHADQKAWDRQLTEARQATWLGEGSSSVQQAALRDLRQAYRNWWANPGHFRAPTFRSRHRGSQGFAVRDVTVRRLSRKWGEVTVPKAGRVRFRWTRPVGRHGSARVTLDRAGRWHVSFVSTPDQIDGPATGEIVGIDRGVARSFQCSDSRRWQTPGLTAGEARRLRLLQRKLARQCKGSNRREATKRAIARLKARERDRRKDLIEKATTELARTVDVVRIEDLRVKSMMASARGTVEAPGRNVAQKRGLNRAIGGQGWTMFAQRLEDKIGDRLERVPAAFTSQRCHECGHTDPGNRESQAVFRCVECGHTANADVNAARNIAAGPAVPGRGRRAARPTGEASTTLPTGGVSHAVA